MCGYYYTAKQWVQTCKTVDQPCSDTSPVVSVLFFQHLNYTIVIVEQSGNDPFNRAQLLNIGVNEILKSEIRNFPEISRLEGD